MKIKEKLAYVALFHSEIELREIQSNKRPLGGIAVWTLPDLCFVSILIENPLKIAKAILFFLATPSLSLLLSRSVFPRLFKS